MSARQVNMESLDKTGLDRSNLNNVCRCCLSPNCYKDISSEYFFSGQKEVYEDLLKITFDIQIANNKIGRRLICEDCILKLREGHRFKQMVVETEQKLSELIYKLDLKESHTALPELIPVNVKTEGTLEMTDEDRTDDHFKDDSVDDEDNEILANLKMEITREELDDSLKLLKVKRRRKPIIRKTKEKIRKKTKKNDEIEKSNTTSKSDKDWLKIAERRGNGPLLRENSLKLISNSTICVFQWNKSRYRCFCCHEPFSDMNLLREHTNSHTMEDIEKKIITQQNRLVKVEVSIICCKLCGVELDSLILLRNHLEHHDIKFDLKEDLLVPFKIEKTLKCQICSQTFSMFRLLNIHMNRHFQKQVCHICGAGFSNLVFLNLHKTRSHRPLKCKECNLNFSNKLDKKEHDMAVHNLKIERKLRFPCPYCSERFFQENFRVQHLVEKHGMVKPEHKCQMCSKVFITRSLCNNHVKNVHLKEKNHECDICHHFFYTKSDVARHRVTHTGEKKFSCNFCNNLFATKDSLRRHMKRTHVDTQ